MPNYAVILPAAGRSSRFRDKHYKKPFAPLARQAVWFHAAQQFLDREDVKQLLIVVAPEDREEFDRKFEANCVLMDIGVCPGGAQRADSIRNALGQVRADIDLVAIHDAARPCLAAQWIERVFIAAEKYGAAILAIPVAATLKRVEKG
jgi:2-C-methyl-D-erythritol 4-phosphate cytidylyltransferase